MLFNLKYAQCLLEGKNLAELLEYYDIIFKNLTNVDSWVSTVYKQCKNMLIVGAAPFINGHCQQENVDSWCSTIYKQC